MYYAEPRRRETVPLTDALREKVRSMLLEMHDYTRRGHTPKAKPGKFCNACSLKDLCLPKLCREKNVRAYIEHRLREDLL